MPSQNQHRSTPLRAASTNNLVRTGEQTPQLPCLSGRTTRAPQDSGELRSRGHSSSCCNSYSLLAPSHPCLTSTSSWYFLGSSPPTNSLHSHPVSESVWEESKLRHPATATSLWLGGRGLGSAGLVHPVTRAAGVCDWCGEGAAAPRKGGWAERWSRQMDLEG